MPKGHGTTVVGVSETAAMKDKELVTFSLVFSFAFLHNIG